MNSSGPKKQIEHIQNQYLHSPELALDSLAGAVDRLQKAFSRRGHFIMEFTQNADDAEARQLVIELSNDKIRILNDGQPFTSKDVESICKVGRSSKVIEDYIGYLGVGFKSVFLISENPQIYSTPYCFEFKKNHWLSPEKLPWQVMPIWIEKTLEKEWNTTFVIPLRNTEIAESIRSEIAPDSLNARVLLFLRKLEEIMIADTNGSNRHIVKKDCGGDIYTLSDTSEGTSLEEQWLVFRKLCEVSPEVKEDYATKEWERENVKMREVLVAFKVNENNNLEEVLGTAHIGVFSFVPLKEEETGLKFLMQADFLTAPGREVITRETKWNQWLAKEISNLVIEKCIPAFLKHKKWRMNFTKVLYPQIGGHALFDEYVKKPLRDYIDNNAVLIAEDGSVITVSQAVSIAEDIRDLLTTADLQTLYPGKKIIHPTCESRMEIEQGPTTTLSFVKAYQTQELMKKKAESKDIKWFKKLYKKLTAYSDDYLKKELMYENIILTSKGKLAKADKVYIKLKRFHIPSEIEANFELVHPALSKDSDILEFLMKLDIEKLTDEHIRSLLGTKELPKISKNWGTLSDSEKKEKITLCKELWEKHQVDIKDLSFLTLKTKDYKWLLPNELILPKEYKPRHNLEQIVEKGLLDLPLMFLSAEFVQDKNEVEINSWHNFFQELGVDTAILQEKQQHIVQRIGIKTALCFEEKKGSVARELGESEKPGYDIKSESPSEERHIEVKGSSDLNPRMALTKKEFETLQTEQDKYFVYVVEDALRIPRLYTVKGSELLKTAFSFITIEAKQWKGLKEEEFQP